MLRGSLYARTKSDDLESSSLHKLCTISPCYHDARRREPSNGPITMRRMCAGNYDVDTNTHGRRVRLDDVVPGLRTDREYLADSY